MIQGPTILLRGGKYFNLQDPDPESYTVEDIAHALSNLCRFSGHCKHFYSVAQHAVYVSLLVPEEHQMAALLHDAAEAFLGDVTTPLKRLLPEYKTIETNLETQIAAKFGLPYPWSAEIRRADIMVLLAEQQQVMQNTDAWSVTQGHTAAGIQIEQWTPEEAKAAFLARYQYLRLQERAIAVGARNPEVLEEDRDAMRCQACGVWSKSVWVGCEFCGRIPPEEPLTFSVLQKRAYAQAVASGFHPPNTTVTVGDRLMLMVSELAEALEEHRAGHFTSETYLNGEKPEGVPIELADVVIRIADFCEKYRINLDAAVKLKMAYNATRPHKHGGKIL